MTNDGEFANFLTHPSHEIKKTYLIHVTGYRDGADALLRRPLMMDGAKDPAAVGAAAVCSW